jgi:hypothetical protein
VEEVDALGHVHRNLEEGDVVESLRGEDNVADGSLRAELGDEADLARDGRCADEVEHVGAAQTCHDVDLSEIDAIVNKPTRGRLN